MFPIGLLIFQHSQRQANVSNGGKYFENFTDVEKANGSNDEGGVWVKQSVCVCGGE